LGLQGVEQFVDSLPLLLGTAQVSRSAAFCINNAFQEILVRQQFWPFLNNALNAVFHQVSVNRGEA
jgi:hypothetical protein